SFFILGPAHTEFCPLSLHDALPISSGSMAAMDRYGQAAVEMIMGRRAQSAFDITREPASTREQRLLTPEVRAVAFAHAGRLAREDRKSTRLNSSHVEISYAVFCLKK